MQEEIIAAIPQGNADTMLEVALVHDATSGTRVELRCLTWGTGLGWYRQHTLTLDRSAARALVRSLGRAQHRFGHDVAPDRGRKVLPLPRLAPLPADMRPQAM